MPYDKTISEIAKELPDFDDNDYYDNLLSHINEEVDENAQHNPKEE